MRRNLPVTQREIPMKDGARLITTTDLNGVIGHCNDEFEKISGFSRDELIGANHNLIRHPDVPPAVFGHMWETLQKGRPWMGVVKNRAKNGDHYWVNAYVTPIYENGKKTGYESVRSKPDRKQVGRAEKIYGELNNGRTSLVQRSALRARFLAAWPFLLSLGISVPAVALGGQALAISAVVVANVLALGFVLSGFNRRTRKLLDLRPDAFQDPLIALMYSDEPGRIGQLSLLLASEEARLRTALTRIEDRAVELERMAVTSSQAIGEGARYIERQRAETDQTASAINEMTASIQEVARNVAESAKEAEEANRHAAEGAGLSRGALASIEQLVERVHGIGNAVAELGRSTVDIGDATNLITEIAEQTNLLALNAAIEAARAGDQGRGFAVVADEVRNLARRTRESTGHIHEVIERFRKQVDDAVGETRKGEVEAGSGLDKVREAERSLQQIVETIGRITDQSLQVSAATEEQSQVADEINRQIINIAELADQSAAQASTADELGAEFKLLAKALRGLVARFSHQA
ncbi:methyl-accepting chemotaxis protein [Marinobacter sp.]|uniref:methyl-accepting chemotaxis protein n=1 Tax=Marinobacter sp. TaxID=50741 RepID=UPI00384A7EA8